MEPLLSVTTRSSAKASGDARYFTGTACRYGHVAERYVNNSGCVDCALACGRLWRKNNPESMKKSRDKWASENPEKDAEVKRLSARRAYEANPKLMNERSKKWRLENKDEHNLKRREKREKNAVDRREVDRQWRMANPEKVKATRQKSYLKTRQKPAARLNAAMAAGIRISISLGSKAKRKWESLVGYSVVDLMSHLSEKFQPGMNWENYGAEGWEIDHIIPLSAHNFQSPEDLDFKRAWSLENLQPLWRTANRSKNNRLSKPFQPSLLIGSAHNGNASALGV